MSSKFFFIKNNKKVFIEGFNYAYTLKRLLKVYDGKYGRDIDYKDTIVINREEDNNGNFIKFNVETISLSEIYYDTKRIVILDLMMEDIKQGIASAVASKATPTEIQIEYEEFLKDEVAYHKKHSKIPLPVVKPVNALADFVPVKKEWIDIKRDDPLHELVGSYELTADDKSTEVLNWYYNFDLMADKLSKLNKQLSEKQMTLVTVIKQNSENIETVFNTLRNTLKDIFPVNKNIFQKIFFIDPKFEVKEESLELVISKIEQSLNVKSVDVESVKQYLKSISDLSEEIISTAHMASRSCLFSSNQEEDPYEFQIRAERMEKVATSTNIIKMSIQATHRKFLNDVEKLHDAQNIIIPMLISKLQQQINTNIDQETMDMVKNLANGTVKIAAPIEDEKMVWPRHDDDQ